ncbi:MAG: cation-transporting P-type ATPase, partial [Candidatus Altiarchaeales archaeon]|nr:cation-transporting P-type ATPase [Candidatus Altiarchaeales archaeon]
DGKKEYQKKKLAEFPFNSINKFSAGLYQLNKKQNIFYICGAPEKILAFSQLSQAKQKKLKLELDKQTKKGLRVVATGYRKIKKQKQETVLKELCQKIVFTGFITLKDPIRKDVKSAISLCRQAGIKPIIVTGDHKFTAKAVAQELGFKVAKENILEGAELDEMTDIQFQKKIKDILIYARVEPKHKLRIISAWQERGEVVAMTGDGVNDAPALKRADIGIAMGITGTDVSKEASDMVLVDDNFSSIVSAVEEGRGIYGNIKKFFAYLISGNIGEVTIIFLSCLIPSLLHIPLPIALTAAQILIINLVTDGLPALALGVDPFEPHAMRRKPRNSKEPIHAGLTPFILGYPIIMVAVTLTLFLWIYNPEIGNVMEAQTVVFLTIAMFEMYQAFSARSTRYPSIEVGIFRNKYLILAVSFSFLFCLALVYLPLDQIIIPFTEGENLRDALHVTYIDPGIFILILLLSSTGFIYLELHKLWREHRSGE